VNGQRQQPDLQARILVAHADPITRTLITRTLGEDGYTASEAGSGREALTRMEATLPDLLILDPSAAEPGDLNLLALLRDHPIRATMATLALDRGAGGLSPLLDAGADDVLAIPLNPQALRLKVQTLLRLKLAERTARELLTRRARDQQALQRANQRLAAGQSLAETLTIAAEVVRANLGYDRVSIALYDTQTQTLRNYVATDAQGRISASPEVPLTVSLAPGSPLRDIPAYQALFEQGQPLFYLPDSGGRAPAYFRPYLDGPVRETLLVALRLQDRPVGLITVDNLLSGRPFGAEDATLLVTLAGQVALAIERARLAEELALRAKEAEALAQVGVALAGTLDPAQLYHLILDQAAKVVPCDHAFVLQYQDGWATLAASWGTLRLPAGTRIFPLKGPDRAWAPATASSDPVYVRDTAREPAWGDMAPWTGENRIRSLITVPLVVEGTVLGTFNVASSSPEYYTERQVALTASFAERVNQALRSARLYAAEQERARAAEELARMRNDFVASVSHELRTPLTAIVGFAEILQARWTETNESDRLEWIDKIVSAAGRQQRLVEDLLLLTRMENGALNPHIERVTLRTIAQRAAEEVQGSYPGQRIDLVGTDRVAVLADPDRALQVVANIVDNAAKYSPEGAPIIVWWGPEEGSGALRVLDRGTGVSPEGREYLFTRFGRVPGSRMRAGRVGTGLGLYLGRGLARAMEGDLDLESTGPDGSTFRLRLPLAVD
jgi:signal transduction histidine kinase/CheY-like chemotaxis protein